MLKAAIFSAGEKTRLIPLYDMSVVLTGGGELITLLSPNEALLAVTANKGWEELTLKFGELTFHQTPITSDANFTFKKEIRGSSIIYTLELLLQPTAKEEVNSDG